jgi:hypothetical protein
MVGAAAEARRSTPMVRPWRRSPGAGRATVVGRRGRGRPTVIEPITTRGARWPIVMDLRRTTGSSAVLRPMLNASGTSVLTTWSAVLNAARTAMLNAAAMLSPTMLTVVSHMHRPTSGSRTHNTVPREHARSGSRRDTWTTPVHRRAQVVVVGCRMFLLTLTGRELHMMLVLCRKLPRTGVGSNTTGSTVEAHTVHRDIVYNGSVINVGYMNAAEVGN